MIWYWIQLVIGAWVILSPWLLGFSGISVMMWSNLVMGMILVLISVWQIFGGDKEEAPAAPAERMEVAIRSKRRNLPA